MVRASPWVLVSPRYSVPFHLHTITAGISTSLRPTKGTRACALETAFCSEMPRMTMLLATPEAPSACFSSVAPAASLAACLECAIRLMSTLLLSQRSAPYHQASMPELSLVLADAHPLAPRLRFVAKVFCSSTASWSMTLSGKSAGSAGSSTPSLRGPLSDLARLRPCDCCCCASSRARRVISARP